jgi:hypothetical protein
MVDAAISEESAVSFFKSEDLASVANGRTLFLCLHKYEVGATCVQNMMRMCV